MKEFSIRTGRLLGAYALMLGIGYGAAALQKRLETGKYSQEGF